MIRTRFARSLGLAALALAASAGAAAAQDLPPAAQLVERYIQAIGGRDVAARLTARHAVAERSMPAMGMTMPMETWTARPNRMLAKVQMSGMTMSSGFDGSVAWATSPMTGPRILDGVELKAALDQANFD